MRTLLCLALVFLFLLACPGLSAQEYPYLGVITGAEVNLRAGQSQSFEEIAQLKQGEQVVVVDKAYSWYKIKLPLQAQSYVSSKFVLKMGDNVGKIMGNKINIRARKSVESTSLGRLNQGVLVRIREQAGDWVQIEPIDPSYGWVHEDFLKWESKEVPPPRVVEPPLRNIYKRKRMMAQQAAQAATSASEEASLPQPEPQRQQNIIKATGIVEDLQEKSITQNIRHRLVGEDNKVYFLKGYRSLIDTFLNYKVHIEGEVLSDIQAPAPVLLVTKIQLVL